MKHWDFTDMLEIGQRLFAKIHKQKRLAHHNHDVHFLAREINVWLPDGIQAMRDGHYTPQHLRRLFLQDEVFDQLRISDRIFQHILLKQLKPTFTPVMNTNCFYLIGPSGVKQATQHVREALQTGKINFVIRADIKSFYRSIPHYNTFKTSKKFMTIPKYRPC